MVGKVTFEIKGAKELEQMLKELGPKVANRLGDKALRAAARPIIREAKRLVPVRTGALRKSITAVRGRGGGQNQRLVLIGFKSPASARAHFIEYGTIRSAAQPFIRPALDNQAGAALEAMRDELARGIAREEYKLAVAAGVDFSEFDEN